MGGHELAANVNVGGTWYGPAHPAAVVTDDVARQISNPKAWPDGKLPELPDPAATSPAEDGDGTGDGRDGGTGHGGTGGDGDDGTGEGATSQRPGRSRPSRRGGDGT